MRLFRYLDKKYVDSFFADGSIMISTLARCRSFEGTDVRGDAGEGSFVSEFRGRRSSAYVKSIHQFAPAGTMILCCSDVYNSNLRERFKVDGCLAILDAELFFEAVSAALALPFTEKVMDRVRYLSDRVERHIVDDELLLPPPIAIPLMFSKVQSLIQAGTFSQKAAEELSRAANGFPDEIMRIVRRDAALCKPQDKFKDESETRMLWFSAQSSELTHVVKCPEARIFCERV